MTDLEIYQPPATQPVALLEIDSWTAVAGQVIRLAKEIYDTPFVPDGLRGSVPAVAAAILAGRELGLPPMTSLANVHVIKGKPALAAVLMRALIQAQGHQWQDVEVTDTRVVIRGRRKGESEWTEVRFTADQMKHAGVALGGWPQDKLYARATSRLARRKFADVIAGMPYSAEEMEDGAADEGTVADDAPAATAPFPKPAQRTARRAARTPAAAAPDVPAAGPDPQPASGPAAAAGPDGPPLPGEDEDSAPAVPDEQAPGGPAAGADRPSPGLVGIIRQHFTRLGFTDDEKDERLSVTSEIAGRAVDSTNELTQAEAKAVTDTLSRCKDRAQLALITAPKDDGDE